MNRIKSLLASTLIFAAIATAIGDTITITSPANPASEQVSHYRFLCATNVDSGYGLIGTNSAPSFTAVLPQGARYYFRVAAQNFCGLSANSGAASTPTIPAMVQGLALSQTGDTVALTWLPNPAGDMVSSYNVKIATNSNAGFVLLGSTAGTNFTQTLNPGHVYYFRVSAINFAGEGSNSGAVSTLPPPSAPGTPSLIITP